MDDGIAYASYVNII